MKKLLILLSVLMLAGVCYGTEPTKFVKFDRVYQAPTHGWVHFDHKAHSTRMGKDCSYCHDLIKANGGYIYATSGNSGNAHTVCRNCHITQNGLGAAAPTSCSSGPQYCHGN
jgi:hypothetical protein